jgi:hypothetical protein
LAAPTDGRAAPYTVEVCSEAAPGADIVLSEDPGSVGFAATNTCGSGRPASGIQLARRGGPSPLSGGVGWTLSAPPGMTIHHFVAHRGGLVSWSPGVVWELTAGGVVLETVTTAPSEKDLDFTVDAGSLVSRMSCTAAPCPAQGQTFIRIEGLTVVIEDSVAPTAAVASGLPAGTPIWGSVEVPYRATDAGGGVRATRLRVDGLPAADVPDTNGGKCAEPFRFLAPCRTEIASAFSLDTTGLSEGPHEVVVDAFDAAGQTGSSAPLTIVVHNAPFALGPPRLQGSANPGGTLTATSGDWGGLRSTYAYQWLRCSADAKVGDASGCTPIPGETGTKRAVVAADLGKRLVVEVTATNERGSAKALSAPSPVVEADTTPPRLSGVSLSRKRFKLARGALLRFSSSEAGKLSIAVSKGRKKAGRPIAVLTREISAGRGKLVLRGRIGEKRLRPGRYRLTLTATDAAGNRSKPVRLAFAVLPA